MLRSVGRFTASLDAFGRVFANRSVRKLQIASIGSSLGGWAYGVALPVYAYHAGGTRAVGLLLFVRFALGAIAAPWMGVLADRGSRRRLMLLTDIVRAGIFAAMTAVALSNGNAYTVYVLAVTSTILAGTYVPAQGALLPSLVDTPEELTAANVVGSTIAKVAMFAGPALGGILLALSGPGAVFALNCALLIWSAVFVAQVPRDEPPERTERPRFLPELTAGFAAVTRLPALRVVVGLTGAETLTTGALEVLLVVIALQLIHAGNAGVGWLNMAFGIGAVVGGIVVAAIAARRRLARGFALGILVSVIPIALTSLFTTLAPTLVLFAVIGAGSTVVEVAGITLIQRSAENDVLGRVFAVLDSMILGALAIGAVAAPALVGWLGLRDALIATGLFLPALLLPLWPSLRRIDAEGRIASEPLELLRRIEIFAELPEPVLERLASTAIAVTALPGQPVVSRGEPGHHFYVVAEGHASVELDGAGAEPRTLEPGDFFGEIALLRDVPRTATVRAIDELRVFAVARDDFLAAVTGHAPTLAAAESVVVSRLPAGALLG